MCLTYFSGTSCPVSQRLGAAQRESTSTVWSPGPRDFCLQVIPCLSVPLPPSDPVSCLNQDPSCSWKEEAFCDQLRVTNISRQDQAQVGAFQTEAFPGMQRLQGPAFLALFFLFVFTVSLLTSSSPALLQNVPVLLLTYSLFSLPQLSCTLVLSLQLPLEPSHWSNPFFVQQSAKTSSLLESLGLRKWK